MSSSDRAVYVFTVLLLSIVAVSAKPNGAPSSACRDMEPGHTEGQTSASQYIAKPAKVSLCNYCEFPLQLSLTLPTCEYRWKSCPTEVWRLHFNLPILLMGVSKVDSFREILLGLLF